mmetsp:Transcript_14197/g.57196  ORF Transcript_14197/g.57196 Transcript_14197/m.57196 type:complete len:150 (-) Transcript_14197:2337-2786(-)
MSPNSALEQRLPQSTVIALVSIASFQVSSSTRMEKYAMDLAAETVKEFQGMKDRYRQGTKIYEQAYKSLRKEAVKLQKKALRSSSDGQTDEINAKLEAAEPVWRAKGESLRAEASRVPPPGWSFIRFDGGSLRMHRFRNYPGRCIGSVT